MESKYSPTPWEKGERWIEADSITDDPDAAIPISVILDAQGDEIFEPNIWENPDANIDHAIHCVNSHDALVAERDRLREALERVEMILDFNQPSKQQAKNLATALTVAQAALKGGE